MPKVTDALAVARREMAAQWLAMPTADIAHHYAERFGHLHRQISGSGLRDGVPSDADRAFIAGLKTALSSDTPRQVSLGKLLAAMLLLFPHELPQRYELDALPAWLLADYMAFSLTGPTMFREVGEADAYCDYAARWTGYLHDKVLANIGNEFWRNIGLFFTQNANFIPLYFNTRNVRELYQQRAAIMEATLRAVGAQLDHKFGTRPQRDRIRVGILADHYAPQTETFATLPVYHHLDRKKFEVRLFALRLTNHRLEQFCARQADQFAVLPAGVGPRLQMLRAADLDLILIGTNTTAVTNDTAVLALHRLARVQVASVCSCTTTGMRNVDYYLSGRLSEPQVAQAHYIEKLVVVDGPAHCYDFGDELPPASTETMNRAALGIGGEAIVFVSGANFYKILPELEEAWMLILAAVPESRLVLYPFNVNWSNAYPVDAFLERLNAAMARHGLEPGRLLVLRAAPNRADVLGRLRLGDVYLDSFPFGGATSLLDPLELGLPAVVMEGEPFRARVGSALLRDMELEELIAKDRDGYVAAAVKLASDKDFRIRMREKIAGRMKAVPKFLDSKWFGEQAGLAFERMWKKSGHGG
ncbi:MAG TPA: hypothetical protein VFC45_07605 [Pseudolabrys sp.]|nr:hypothetical protein [Pseudolabrys sp.]